jgi:hypothetical protein
MQLEKLQYAIKACKMPEVIIEQTSNQMERIQDPILLI